LNQFLFWDCKSLDTHLAIAYNIPIRRYGIAYDIGETNGMLNTYSDHGLTPLHVAKIHGHHEMVALLVSYGADTTRPMLPCMVDGCNESCRVAHDCQVVHPKSA